MGLHQHVRNRDLVPEIGPTARMPRIWVATDEVPGPAMKGDFDDTPFEYATHVVEVAFHGWPWHFIDMRGIFKRRVVADAQTAGDNGHELERVSVDWVHDNSIDENAAACC